MDARIARIIDVNANRVREALRVLEDYARFTLDDPVISEKAKTMRHDFCRIMDSHNLADTIRSRDIVNDVGKTITTETEHLRTSATAVTMAASKRVSEALRSLEEYAKTITPALGPQFETIRYRSYELDRQISIRQHARDVWGSGGLYVLITESLCSGDWFDTVKKTIQGGARCLQLREKNLPTGELLERAKRFCDYCREHDVLSVINDRPDIAILAGADGIHVGQDDLPVQEVRRLADPAISIGMSTHTLQQAEAAMLDSPSYIAVGPMFQTATKPQDHIPGPQLVSQVKEKTSLPVVAIGGINPNNSDVVVHAGADWICVCSSVIARPDVREAARSIAEKIHQE